MINLERILKEKIDKIEIRISKTAEERDESSTPNESNHKLIRQISDQLYNSLVDVKHSLLHISPKIKKFKTIFKIQKMGSENIMDYFIVPDGLGGVLDEGVLLVGQSSPIAIILATKNIGDEYEFNDSNYCVIDIFENS